MTGVVVIGETEDRASEQLPSPSEGVSDATVEAVAQAASEVAQIEADRDIAVAAIDAETQSKAIEAASATDAHMRELQECRQSIETLRATTEAQATEIQSIRAELKELRPNPSPPADDGDGVTPDSQEAREPPPRRKPAHRWI